MSSRIATVTAVFLTAFFQVACSTVDRGIQADLSRETYPAAPIKIALLGTLPFRAWEGEDGATKGIEVVVKQKGRTCHFTFGTHQGTPFRVGAPSHTAESMVGMPPFAHLSEYAGGQAGPLWAGFQGGAAYWFYYDRGVMIRSDGSIQEFKVLNPSVPAGYLDKKWSRRTAPAGNAAMGATAGEKILPLPEIVIVAR